MVATLRLVGAEEARSFETLSKEQLACFMGDLSEESAQRVLFPDDAEVMHDHLKQRGPWTEERLERVRKAIDAVPMATYGESRDDRALRAEVHARAIENMLKDTAQARWLLDPLHAYVREIHSAQPGSAGHYFLQRVFLAFLTTPLAPPK